MTEAEKKPSPWSEGDKAMDKIANQGVAKTFDLLTQLHDQGMGVGEKLATASMMLSLIMAANSILYETEEETAKRIDSVLNSIKENCLKRRKLFQLGIVAGDQKIIDLIDQLRRD